MIFTFWVLIVDDSDLPKTGFHIEAIGKVYSHVHQRCLLGFKVLMLSWSDGRSQFVLDFSLHGEKGKKEGKEQGLTAKQRQERFSRERTKDSPAAQRKEEYFVSKCDRFIVMVKAAILRKIPLIICWLIAGLPTPLWWTLCAVVTRSFRNLSKVIDASNSEALSFAKK